MEDRLRRLLDAVFGEEVNRRKIRGAQSFLEKQEPFIHQMLHQPHGRFAIRVEGRE